MTQQPSVADAANRYAAAGWPVHPLHDTAAGHCSCATGPDCRQPGKHPRTAHGFRDATRDPAVVARWWRRWPHANIGVPTGSASRLAVVDLDGAAGSATWHALVAEHGGVETAIADTPHGRHLWHRIPDGLTVPRSIRDLGDGIDVLGDDGYAIAAPSTITSCPKQEDRECGNSYCWTASTRQLAPLPAWIPQQLAARTSERSTCEALSPRLAQHSAAARDRGGSVRHPRRYALAALRGEAERVASAAPGERNDALNYAAWRLAEHVTAGSLTEHEVRDRLTRAAATCGLAHDDGATGVHNTISSALRTGGRSL